MVNKVKSDNVLTQLGISLKPNMMANVRAQDGFNIKASQVKKIEVNQSHQNSNVGPVNEGLNMKQSQMPISKPNTDEKKD